MISGWPVRHTYKHLKREVLYNLIDEREEYCMKLQFHLDKQDMCYRDAVLEINKRDGDEDIPPALGDFILVAISLTIKLPIYVIYLTVEHTMDANDRPVTKYFQNIEYLFCKDANKAKSQSPDLIVVVFNGLDYYAPTALKEIAHMTRNVTTASTHIEDTVSLVDKIVLDLPPSTTCDSLTKSLKFMRAANIQLEGTSLATGTAVSTGMPVEVPILKLASLSNVAKSVHKRAAVSLGQVPPEKRKGESDDAFASQKKKYTETVSITAARDTKLGPFQCPCFLNYVSMQELLDHQANVHPDPTNWKCAHCPSVSNSKGHCWSHSHHHLNKWYHYCDCEYLDKKDKDLGSQRKSIVIKALTNSLALSSTGRHITMLAGIQCIAIIATNRNKVCTTKKHTIKIAVVDRIKIVHWLAGVTKRAVGTHAGQHSRSTNTWPPTTPLPSALQLQRGGSAVSVGKNSSHHRATKGMTARLSKSGSQERGEHPCLILVGNITCDELH